ncbi:MAG: orotate phosphoribosyltransferase [Candidatus Woesebacteria bacterium]
MNTQEKVANALLDISAVGFALDKPLTFKSGIISPVYVDNRKLPFHVDAWKIVIEGLQDLIAQKQVIIDVLAGIETAGIPHSSVVGYEMRIPSVIIRKAAKDHGTKKKIEGGSVKGLHAAVLEDHITTAGSSLHGVHELKEAGAIVDTCLAITSYGWKEAEDAFATEGVRLLTLTTFPIILEQALKRSLVTKDEVAKIKEWLEDPHGWAAKHGF